MAVLLSPSGLLRGVPDEVVGKFAPEVVFDGVRRLKEVEAASSNVLEEELVLLFDRFMEDGEDDEDETLVEDPLDVLSVDADMLEELEKDEIVVMDEDDGPSLTVLELLDVSLAVIEELRKAGEGVLDNPLPPTCAHLLSERDLISGGVGHGSITMTYLENIEP